MTKLNHFLKIHSKTKKVIEHVIVSQCKDLSVGIKSDGIVAFLAASAELQNRTDFI